MQVSKALPRRIFKLTRFIDERRCVILLVNVVQWNHACFGVRGVSKHTGSNPVHGPSVAHLQKPSVLISKLPGRYSGNSAARVTTAAGVWRGAGCGRLVT
ncbi:hypothetical protein E2C01_032449 [Portunus trituberculatus]|uniref:Uncharacterized protein n=1 Tax=Portunus trituberculatus TaxID=210409 RepID=A0A5B7EW12_PORTR|nr:hypothetical protein [Portunus trituberculatus]